MYRSKQSQGHRPKTLMSQGGKLAEAAVVAAPFESKSLVSFVNLPRVRKEPDWKVN